MGIVNLTDNSFFSLSRLADNSVSEIARRVGKMLQDGADIIDIGACSTAPHNPVVDEDIELSRLERVVPFLFEAFPDVVFSIDSFRPSVIRRMSSYGRKFIVNDVRAATPEAPAMFETVSELDLPYVAMDSSTDPYAFFEKMTPVFSRYGLKNWILDPGFGFGKSVEENWNVLENLGRLKDFGRPILASMSRKRMVYMKYGLTPETCARESVAAEMLAVVNGASIIRTHDLPAHNVRQ